MNSMKGNSTVSDQLRAMLIKERQSSYSCYDYLHPTTMLQPGVSALDRYQLCQWAYSILSSCSFDTSVGSIAFSYFDRFLCSQHPRAKLALTSQHEFQLVFMTAFALALKTQSGMNVELDFFAESICCDLYKVEEFVETEMAMLVGLNWKLNGPSPHDFIEYFVNLLPADEDFKSFLIKDSKVLTAEAVMHYSEAIRLPSSIALSSLIKSIEQADELHPLLKLRYIQAITYIANAGYCPHLGSTNSQSNQEVSTNKPCSITAMTHIPIQGFNNKCRQIFSPSA